ncbi:MAG: hypothetical protein JW958_02300, partial [Candidatus Eisenbacteria bacterium]|nr:hypothetical protein [Candidatus Eisenbacteria bacterium]
MRWARVAMIVWAGTLAFAAVASAQSSITHTITFDPSAVEYESRDGYNLIRMEDCRFEIVPGRPMIPARTLQFSVPADMRVAEVRVLSVDRVDLGDDFLLYPAQPYARTSDEHAPAFVEPEKTVYEGTAPYPGETAKLLNNGVLSGYRIAGVKVYPFEYLPAERRLVLNRSVRIELVLEAAEPVRTIAGRDEAAERAIADRIRSIVVNPEKVDEYIGPRAEKSRDAGVAYAIITGDSYVDEFQPLADWKTLKGVKTEIFTVSWISSNYSGLDDQEKIRNFILDYEANQGLQYVLLGGDVDVVPARVVWDEVENDGIRADMYFSDTDGDWNADGDSRYGEYPSDNVDMYADIYVGRAPVNTSSEASNFVNQVLTYEGASTGSTLPTDFQEEMLFLAEILWDDPDPYTDHGILKDWIDTNYVPSNFDPITKLYERDGNLNYTSAMNALNDGPNITNHCGHCNYNVMSIGPSALYNSDMDALDNGDRKGLYYTMGCWAAAFDYDNIAEHYVNNPDGGGIAFVGNSRYGWACPGYPGECASDVFDKEFFRALFDDNIYRTGITHADHKDALVPESQSDEYMRYCLYELNLLGDPETPLWTETPQALAVNHPGTLPTGASYYTVSVTMGGSPVEDALVCLMKGTEVYETGLTNSSGQVTLEPSPDTGGSVSVTVTAQNGLPYEGSATVEEGTPPAAPTGLAAVEGDGQVSLAWDPNAEPDIDYYVLYRAQSPNPTDSIAAIDAPDTSYLDTDVENDSTYYYRVRAVDTEGDRSGYSNEVSATPFWTPSIFITHTPVEDTDECNHDIPVTATITSTVAPLLPDSILVVYETQAQRAWESAVLSATGTPNEYAGEIPGQPCGTLVNYYILAVDENHDRETDPDGAPAAYHSFTVSYTVVFEDDFETDKGWTVGDAGDDATTGIWER